MIVSVTYYAQTCPKWFLAVMTPMYIAFTLTDNWYDQTSVEMGNWYYMGHWINVWNFRRKKVLFKMSTLSFVLSVNFGFLTPKLIKIQIFMKNSGTNPKYEWKCITNFQDGCQENRRQSLWSKLLIAKSQKLLLGVAQIRGAFLQFFIGRKCHFTSLLDASLNFHIQRFFGHTVTCKSNGLREAVTHALAP